MTSKKLLTDAALENLARQANEVIPATIVSVRVDVLHALIRMGRRFNRIDSIIDAPGCDLAAVQRVVNGEW